MNTNDLNTALYEKMAAEQDKFRDWLKRQPPEEILHHTYEYTVREDIVMAMEELELTDAQAQALLESPSPLADVYRYFEKLETGYMDVGYGNISEPDTLLDTNTGGLNLITGLSAGAMNAMSDSQARDEVISRLNNSPVALVGKAVIASDNYIGGGSREDFSSALGSVMDTMTETEHSVSTVYSDLGNKYSLLESTEEKLTTIKLALTEQYKEKLGADPYEAITEMFSYQQSYNAALRVGSNMMSSSLFDFVK